MLRYNRKLIPKARKLRASMTDSERKLWRHLRGKQVLGVRFYRQRPIGDYIVDFYASVPKLVIEVDGAQHYEHEGVENDAVRDAYLEAQGLKVLHFNNLQVPGETDAVVEMVRRHVHSGLHT